MNAYLGKEYEKLITAEVICHGVPSQKLFHKYLDCLSKKFKSKVVEYNFRSKDKLGLEKVSMVKTEDGRVRYIEPDFDPYYSNFLNCLTFRKSCYQCHYTNYNRVSNFTMGDFLGIEKTYPKFYKEIGNSLILVNDEKAEKLLESLKGNLEILETNIDLAARYNANLKKPSSKPQERDTVYNEIDEKNSRDFMKDNLKIKVTTKKLVKAILPLKVRIWLKKLKGFGK